ncbi:MAG: sigma-70 family RNA polymerase sigma factor [Planctomycetes bacterium]|nr:sigma-70 family RNA polymerase sigma factor [Planctomycetota bacterium]
MDSQVTRVSLLSRVRNPADDAAWREFDGRYRELVLRYARARGLQHSDAEDVRQVVMLGLSRSLRGFAYDPGLGRFRDYLGRCVRNAVARHLSRPKPAAGVLDTHVLADAAGSDADAADALWDEEWTNHHYRLAMESIRAGFEARSVAVFERLVGGEGVEAVAEAFGLSTQAVHKVKQRIRDRMKELIAAQIREEDEPDAPPGA